MSDREPGPLPPLPVTLPDTALAIPRNTERRDQFPIHKPEPKPQPHRVSLAARRRRQLRGF